MSKIAAKRFLNAIDKLVPAFRRDIAREKNKFIRQQIAAYKNTGRLSENITYAHEMALKGIFKKNYEKIFKRAIAESPKLAPDLKNLIPVWEVKRSKFDDYLREYYFNGADDYVFEVAKTTEADIRRLMQRAFESELPEEQVIKAGLRARGLSVMRSNTIARTETHKAAMFASKKTIGDFAKEANVSMLKEWNATQDERTRISHSEADGQQIEMDSYFEVGGEKMDRPADPGASAENVINCRCVMTYKVDFKK